MASTIAIFFMDQLPKGKETRAKINKWDLMKSFCMSMEKIFANNITNKGLISGKLIQLNFKKKNKTDFKWAEEFNRKFSKEEMQMVNKYITNYQENANQSHNEISPHTYLNGCHKKINK